MTDKEVLIAYVSTLPEKKCREAYQILSERFEIHKRKYLLFNRQGVEAKAPDGKIRLRPFHYERILRAFGEEGFHRLVELLYDYIVYLEENTDCVYMGRRKLKELQTVCHYNILTKGWVADKYFKENPNLSIKDDEQNDIVDFFDIDSKFMAIRFIEQTPPELRFDNDDIAYLMTKYDIKQEEINE